MMKLQLTLEQHVWTEQVRLDVDFFNKYIRKIFGDLRQTENNILFSLAYFIVKIQYIHTKYVLIDYVAGKASVQQ